MTKATKDFRFDRHYYVSFYGCKEWPGNKTRVSRTSKLFKKLIQRVACFLKM